MTLDLPWPPSVNSYWRNLRGRTLLSRRGREYREALEAHILLTKAFRRHKFREFPNERLHVTLTTYAPDKRRRDLDNVCKAVLDGLAHAGVYADDSQIDHLEVVRGEVRKPGMVRVRVCPLEENK